MTSDAESIGDLLLVEDNPGDLRLVEEAFRDSRLETTLHAVSTGERAVEFLHRRSEFETAPEPDVLLLDWNLPRMDGADVLRECDANFSHIPVVVMSGTDAEVEAIRSDVDRADAYLTKPSDPDGYIDAVLAVL